MTEDVQEHAMSRDAKAKVCNNFGESCKRRRRYADAPCKPLLIELIDRLVMILKINLIFSLQN